jgi:hypothetical protein
MRVRKKVATILVVLCAILLGVDGGRVMCFGSDGHVGVESLGEGHRMERGSPLPAPASLSQADRDHGPCIDEALLPNPVVQAGTDDVGPTTATTPALDIVSVEDVASRSHVAAWSLELRWRPTAVSLAAVGLSITVLRV